jgi:hypothetical protein
MEKLNVEERERIEHRDIALERYKDLAFRACNKSKPYCRPLVKHPPVDVFRAEQGGMSLPRQCICVIRRRKESSC